MESSDARRLEELWSGTFGDAYVERNDVPSRRGPFWRQLLDHYRIQRVLEVGCNVGSNLQWIAEKVPQRQVFGIDVNEKALSILRDRLHVNAIWSLAREIPFRNEWFDLVFTAGVLIHQPEASLHDVMSEIVRCSNRYVLCMEYFADETVEVRYRGQKGALFKRDYGKIYTGNFPQLRPLERGFLSWEQGWDDVTWWLFEKKK